MNFRQKKVTEKKPYGGMTLFLEYIYLDIIFVIPESLDVPVANFFTRASFTSPANSTTKEPATLKAIILLINLKWLTLTYSSLPSSSLDKWYLTLEIPTPKAFAISLTLI